MHGNLAFILTNTRNLTHIFGTGRISRHEKHFRFLFMQQLRNGAGAVCFGGRLRFGASRGQRHVFVVRGKFSHTHTHTHLCSTTMTGGGEGNRTHA